jgi:hypothetical protein
VGYGVQAFTIGCTDSILVQPPVQSTPWNVVFAPCSVPSAVSTLRSSCQSALSSLRMPSTRNEEYRYTDISSLLNSALAVAPADVAVNSEQLEQLAVPEAAGSRVVLVNGAFRPELSDLSAVGEGVYVGGAAGAPADVLQQLVSAWVAVLSSCAAMPLLIAWQGVAASFSMDLAWTGDMLCTTHAAGGGSYSHSAGGAPELPCIGTGVLQNVCLADGVPMVKAQKLWCRRRWCGRRWTGCCIRPGCTSAGALQCR